MDFKHLNRIKWQHLVLDEAQAIKSSSRFVNTSMTTFVEFHSVSRKIQYIQIDIIKVFCDIMYDAVFTKS